MHIKKDDIVKVLSGKDRGMTGKILSLDLKNDKAVVEGVNLYFRHQRPKKSGEKGQRLKLPMPLHVSKLMVVDSDSKVASRTKKSVDSKGNKVRVSIKSKKVKK